MRATHRWSQRKISLSPCMDISGVEWKEQKALLKLLILGNKRQNRHHNVFIQYLIYVTIYLLKFEISRVELVR